MNVDPANSCWGFGLKATNAILVVAREEKSEHHQNQYDCYNFIAIHPIVRYRYFSLDQSGAPTERQTAQVFLKFENKLACFCVALSGPLSTCNLITFSNRRNAFISSRGNNLLSHINIPFALPLRFPPACPSSSCHSQLLAIIFLPTWPLTLLVPLWQWHLNPVVLLNASFLT